MSSSMLKYLSAGAVLLSLAACVDSNTHRTGSSGEPETTVRGVAATGAPISGGTVNLSCGNGYSTSTTTSSNGQWSTTVPADELPCNVKVSGGTPAGTFYSVAQKPSGMATTTTANITPLTDLATAAALNSADGTRALETWFANASPELRQQVADGIAAATVQLRTALNDAGYDLPAGDFDPFTAAIVAGGAEDLYDQILEAYKAALAAASKDYEDARGDYVAGAELPSSDTTPPPSGEALPDDKLGVSFDDASASHLWLQPSGQGGISAINGNGDGQVIASMGDSTNNGPDGTVMFNILPNKLGTFACGDAVGNGKLHMQVTFQGITNPRKSYISYQEAADPADRTLLPGYSCSVTLTHVGAFTSQYIYGDDYIEGTFTAKLRQTSQDCVGEGNCSPYKELTVTRGKFRINKSGVYTAEPVPATGAGILGKVLKETLAGDYTLKCSESQGLPVQAYAFKIKSDGSSVFDGTPLIDATHAGKVVAEGFPPSVLNVTFQPKAANSAYVVLGFKPDGTFYPNSVHLAGASGKTLYCYLNSGNVAPATSVSAVSAVTDAVKALARSQSLNCDQAGAQDSRTFSINSDASAQLGSQNFAASKLSKVSDDILFGTTQRGSVSYVDVSGGAFRSLAVDVDASLATIGALLGTGLGPNDVSTCTLP